MGVYSVMLPDERLIKAVKGLNRIVILGCGGCANESLAYEKDVPQKAVFDKHLGQYMPAPDAITEESNRLAVVFNNQSNDIQVAVGMGLCSRTTSDKPEEWVRACSDAEGVVALCCTAGIIGIKTILGKTVKVIPGMQTVGVHYSYKVLNPDTGQLRIDRDKSAFIRVNHLKPGEELT